MISALVQGNREAGAVAGAVAGVRRGWAEQVLCAMMDKIVLRRLRLYVSLPGPPN